MKDPVVLCATGQVYDYGSLKDWLKTGNRRCPKSNVEVVDVQVPAGCSRTEFNSFLTTAPLIGRR